jgi:4-amino-4-deoxy-L-arabinose transferase-like glycosyltransferase
MSASIAWARNHPIALLAGFVAVLTLGRIIALALTPLNLGPDEAQYWSWSLYPSAGYFSKPPLIAWLIGASTAVCGTSEFCIRLPSPLVHAATGFVLFLAARRLYDERVAFWSAISYWLMPGTSFSSLLITTDVALLFFWALALWAIAEMRNSRSIGWAILLGTSVGLGLLSKYAMIYFVLGLGIALLWARDTRQLMRDARLMLAGLIALLILAPNVIWNMTNGLATVRHTAANANWNAENLFNASNALGFIGAQAGIIGPLAAGVLIWGAVMSLRRWGLSTEDRLLVSFSAPIVLIVTLQAFISRAHANWAAPAFIALSILMCAWALRGTSRWPLAGNAFVNGAVAVLLCALAASPALVSFLGQDNAAKRLRGWPEAGETIMTIASSAPFTAIISDDREDMASLTYYTRDRKLPLRTWPSANPGNEYEARHALTPDIASYVLLVTRRQDASNITSTFTSTERIGTIETRLDAKRTRIFYLYALTGPVTAATYPSFSDHPSTD